jgi:hypothetical protein
MYKFTDFFKRRMRKESSCKYHMNFQVTKLFIYKKKKIVSGLYNTAHSHILSCFVYSFPSKGIKYILTDITLHIFT